MAVVTAAEWQAEARGVLLPDGDLCSHRRVAKRRRAGGGNELTANATAVVQVDRGGLLSDAGTDRWVASRAVADLYCARSGSCCRTQVSFAFASSLPPPPTVAPPARSKVQWEVLLQALVSVAMVLLFVVGRLCGNCTRASTAARATRTMQPPDVHTSLLRLDSDDEYDSDARSGSTTPAGSHSRHRSRSTISVNGGGGDTSPADVGKLMSPIALSARDYDARLLPLRARVIAAAVNFSLTVYSTLTIAVVQLLRCVRVPGADPTLRFLFIQGSVLCQGSVQLAFYGCLVILVVLPFSLPALASWACRGNSGRERSLVRDLRSGVRRALSSAYRDGGGWWESVLMLHRLALAMVYTFASAVPGVQALVMTVVCVTALTAHLVVRPMRSDMSQHLQVDFVPGTELVCRSSRVLSSSCCVLTPTSVYLSRRLSLCVTSVARRCFCSA